MNLSKSHKREENKRIRQKIEDIDYSETQIFFKNRAKKFSESNPYSVTMYQDHDPKLVEHRNKKEIDQLLPLLKIDDHSKILDIACGIGRWSDAITMNIQEYCGIDFSKELINIAVKRNLHKTNRDFFVGSASELEEVLKANKKGKYNRILLVGIIMYLNEEDIMKTLLQIEQASEEHSIICIREAIGISDRLTLKNFYSRELNDTYNAIYRTREELMHFFQFALISKGFKITRENFLFSEEKLNNRKETAQYYYILER